MLVGCLYPLQVNLLSRVADIDQLLLGSFDYFLLSFFAIFFQFVLLLNLAVVVLLC